MPSTASWGGTLQRRGISTEGSTYDYLRGIVSSESVGLLCAGGKESESSPQCIDGSHFGGMSRVSGPKTSKYLYLFGRRFVFKIVDAGNTATIAKDIGAQVMGLTAAIRGIVQTVAVLLLVSSAQLSAAVKIERSANKIDVTIDGRPFTTYYFDPEVAKPYLMPLRTPSGAVVTRSFPVRNDVSQGDPKASSFEPHQRPLYFGHGDLNGLDFWQEPIFDQYYSDHGHQAYGHMVLKSVEEAASDDVTARIRARFTLNDPSNRVIAEETQSYIFRGDDRTRTIDCEFVLYATAGPLDIGDSKEGTFGIRLAPELSGSFAHMTNSEGAEGEKAIWGKPAEWVEYTGVISGQPVGVAIFDSPTSFRHPTTWHARAYGLFAANPFGIREFTRDLTKDGSWSVPEGKSVTFRYRVLIYDGQFSGDEMKAAYRKYASEK